MYGHRMELTAGELRIVMRPYSAGEATEAVDGFQRYSVMQYLFPLWSAQTLADEEAFIERIRTDEHQVLWAVCVVQDGKEIPVGSTSIRLDQKRGLSGIALYKKEWWGKGIASATHAARTVYAFDVLDLVAIDSKVILANGGSLRALEKVGYCRTGIDYHIKVVAGEVCHAVRLTLVNPSPRAWGYFWGDTPVPPEFAAARAVTEQALEAARRNVVLA